MLMLIRAVVEIVGGFENLKLVDDAIHLFEALLSVCPLTEQNRHHERIEQTEQGGRCDG